MDRGARGSEVLVGAELEPGSCPGPGPGPDTSGEGPLAPSNRRRCQKQLGATDEDPERPLGQEGVTKEEGLEQLDVPVSCGSPFIEAGGHM